MLLKAEYECFRRPFLLEKPQKSRKKTQLSYGRELQGKAALNSA